MIAAIEDIGTRHRGDRVLVITHGWVMDVVSRHIAGHPRDAVLHVKRKNGESVWVTVAQTIQVATAPPSELLHFL